MEEREYQTERSRLQNESARLRAQADEREADLAALDRLWKNWWASNGDTSRLFEEPGVRDPESFPDAVRLFAGTCEGAFTSTDVKEWMKENYPVFYTDATTYYSKTLARMYKKGQISLIKRGSGPKGTKYRKAQGVVT